jgi:hypothetical protein
VSIGPSGDKFCNDGKLKIDLKTDLAGASIYYTIDGTAPKCQTNGTLYSAPFALSVSKTVKAVSCHDSIQSLIMSRNFNVSSDYCDNSSIKINKVFYNTDKAHMATTCPNENEWVELYNPTAGAINIKGWKICDGQACDVLSSKDLSIPSKGYAVITDKEATWQFWNIPSYAIKIVLNSEIGDGLTNTADMVEIKDAAGKIIDETNWGTPSASWANYNSGVWNPGFGMAAEGSIFARITNGYDTDKMTDWTVSALPSVTLVYPNGGETLTGGKTYTIKWTAASGKSVLSMDLYYSNDSGKTWVNIVNNTENDGAYEWKVPLTLNNSNEASRCVTASKKAKIKVVATDYARNFMFSNFDISNSDFYPAIDLSLLNTEEQNLLKTMDTTGMNIINSGSIDIMTLISTEVSTDSGDTSDTSKSPVDTGSQSKSSEMLGKDDKDYLLSENEEKDAGKDADDKDDISQSGVNEISSTSASVSTETAAGTVTTTTVKTASENGSSTAVSTAIINTENAALIGTAIQSAATSADSIKTENKVSDNLQAAQITKTASEGLSITSDKDAIIEFNLNA